MTVSEFIQTLKVKLPGVKFYNGTIDKNSKQCVGVYARGNEAPVRAIGSTSSYDKLPIFILVHWTENADTCQIQAQALYDILYEGGLSAGGKRIIDIALRDPCPVDISRDENNICEMVIRATIIYER